MDETDFSSTPANYATPKQLEFSRELAKALMVGNREKATGAQFPVVSHWSQGVSNVINALMGGREAYKASQQELAMHNNRMQGVKDMVRDEVNRIQAGQPIGYASPDQAASIPTRAAAPTISSGGMGRDYKPGIEPDDSPLYEPKGTPPDNMGLGNEGFENRWGDTPTGPAAPVGQTSIPFSPDSSSVPSTAQDAIAQALSKGAARGFPFGDQGGALALSKKAPAPYGQPQAEAPNTTYIDPRTLPVIPKISPGNLQRILSDTSLTPEQQKRYEDMYINQVQPIVAPYTGGNVRIGRTPNADGQLPQQFIPDPHWGKVKAGDVEFDRPQIITPRGMPGFDFQRSTIPSTGGGPPVSGGRGPLGAPPPGPNVKDLMKFAPDEGDQPAGPFAAGPPNTKVAQSAIDPEIQDMANWSQQRAIDKARQEHFNQKDIDSYMKDYDTLATSGQKAAAGLSQLEQLKNVVSDPRFYSGIGGEAIVLPYKQLMAQFGNDPQAASRMELFRKGISGQIVEDMKIMLQGLGQVRVAEIDLLAKSSASLNQTRAGNEAVLELAIRSHKLVNALSKAANLYRQGYNLDKDGNFVYTGQAPTKAGQDALLKRVTEENPILSKEERIKYDNLFKPGTYDKQKYEQTKKEMEAAVRGEQAPPPNPNAPNKPPPPGFR